MKNQIAKTITLFDMCNDEVLKNMNIDIIGSLIEEISTFYKEKGHNFISMTIKNY